MYRGCSSSMQPVQVGLPFWSPLLHVTLSALLPVYPLLNKSHWSPKATQLQTAATTPESVTTSKSQWPRFNIKYFSLCISIFTCQCLEDEEKQRTYCQVNLFSYDTQCYNPLWKNKVLYMAKVKWDSVNSIWKENRCDYSGLTQATTKCNI